jgi:hypothetical protein
MREKLLTFGKETAKTSPEKVVLEPMPLAVYMKHGPDVEAYMSTQDAEYAKAPTDSETVRADGTVDVGLVQYVMMQDSTVKKETKMGPAMFID